MSGIRDRITELRRVRAGDLHASPKNWRTHPESQVAALRGTLAEIGYADAVLCRVLDDGSLEIIDGHARKELDPDQVIPCLVTDLSEPEAAKLLLTLDPLAAMAEADTKALERLMQEVDTDSEALQAMIDALAAEHGIGVDETPPAPDPEPQIDRAAELQKQWGTEQGQLWTILGKAGVHRVMCGDSTKAEDVARLMAGEKAGLCFTSPPYGQQRDYTTESKEKLSDWDGLMQGVFDNLQMEPAGQVLVNLGLIHRECEWVPYWESWIDWMRQQGWRRFGWYVWDQGSGLPGDWNGRLGPSFEFVWHFNREALRPEKWIETSDECRARKGKGAIPIGFRKEGGSVSCTSPDKLGQDYKIPDSVIRVCRSPVDGRNHPASFPVGLASYVIQSWPGIVYDPFLGSGMTMIAAENLSRICYGMEISPAYVAVILQRAADAGLTPTLEPGP